jgi:hypothetical protein
MGKMFNKLFEYFYQGCHMVEEATRQMMVELDRIGINYDKQTVRKKRRIKKTLGRFQLFRYLKVTKTELDHKCVNILNYLEVIQGEAVWWLQSYYSWRENKQRARLMEEQVAAKVNETTDINNFEEINNLAETSVDIPGPQ